MGGDANTKDGNEKLLEDIQAKMVLLREAMDNVDEAVKSFVKQQGKEKKKKNKKKAGKKGDGEVNGKNEIVEGDSVGKNKGKEGEAIAEVCKDMVDEALAFLGKLGD